MVEELFGYDANRTVAGVLEEPLGSERPVLNSLRCAPPVDYSASRVAPKATRDVASPGNPPSLTCLNPSYLSQSLSQPCGIWAQHPRPENRHSSDLERLPTVSKFQARSLRIHQDAGTCFQQTPHATCKEPHQ